MLDIAADSCYSRQNYRRTEQTLVFRLSPEDLDQLYTCLQDHFYAIEVRTEEEVYDRGGVHLQLRVGGETHIRADSDVHFVTEQSRSHLQAILSTLEELITPHLDAARVSVPLSADASLRDRPLVVRVNGLAVYEGDGASADAVTHLPGEVWLELQVDELSWAGLWTLTPDKPIQVSLRENELGPE